MKLFLKNLSIIPRWIIFFLDLCFASFAFFLAGVIRFNFDFQIYLSEIATASFLWYIGAYLLSMLIFRPFIGVVRYTHTRDIFTVMKVAAFASALLICLNIVNLSFPLVHTVPYGIIVVAAMFTSTFLIGYRFVVKEFFDFAKRSIKKKRKTVIYGAGMAGRTTADVLESNDTEYEVLFFLDDNEKISNNRLYGKKIVFPGKSLRETLKGKQIDELIIAVQDISPDKKRWIIEECLLLSILVKEVPSVHKWVGGHLSAKQIKDVRIEDLLGRKQINVASTNAVKELGGKVVLVTGAAGSIGSEISRQIVKCGPLKLILLDQAESPLYDLMQDMQNEYGNLNFVEIVICDITDELLIERIFHKNRPDVVFHAAAYKHVPLMEDHPFEAVKTNVLGSKSLADLSVKYGAKKFVFVSTDKAVNPTNIMGASKRAAEMYIQALNAQSSTEFITTRFGNVLGSNGSVIPLFKKQIKKGGPITITHPEITRYFMTIPEACSLVLEAGAMGNGGEIFVFDMGKSVKIVDLAKKMVALAGLEIGKDIDLKVTGLRPGEKLYEELLSNKENTKPTHHPKIMIANVELNDFETVNYFFMAIRKSLLKSEEFEMIRKLKSLVPEFKSEVSRFKILDR